jgi:hypothetical protein
MISSKAKQFLIVAAKLSVVAAAFYFIYIRLAGDAFSWQSFSEKLREKMSPLAIISLLILSFLNRFFEILKWQNLVSSFRQISVAEASKQVLGALTVSIFTPSGIGEYGAKALFYESDNRKKILFLNLVSNGIQMVLTIVFGTFGLLYFNTKFNIITTRTVTVLFVLFCLLVLTSILVKGISIKGYSLEKLLKKVRSLPKTIHRKNTLLAISRYLIFSHQYYLLFIIFDVNVPYLTIMSAIAGVYFLASALPTFQFFDFAIKGSIAVYFFSFLGVNEWIPVFIATLMWLLNVVLPVVIGSYFVISFKPQWKQ